MATAGSGCWLFACLDHSDVDASHVPSLLSRLQSIDKVTKFFINTWTKNQQNYIQPLHSWSIDRLIRKAMTGNFYPQKPHPTGVT
jgi:hypothetical protein